MFDLKHCAVCGANGGCKKRVFHFDYSYKAKVCGVCCSKFDSGQDVIDWLGKNAIFAKEKIVGFRMGKK